MLHSYHSRIYTHTNNPVALYSAPSSSITLPNMAWYISLQPNPRFPPPCHQLPPFPVLETLRWDPLQDRGEIPAGKHPNMCCPHKWAMSHLQSHSSQGDASEVSGIYSYTEQRYRNASQSPPKTVHYLKVCIIYKATLPADIHWGKAE